MCRGGDRGAMQRLARRDIAERQRAVAAAEPERVVISTVWDFEAHVARRVARSAALQAGGVFPAGRTAVAGAPLGTAPRASRGVAEEEGEVGAEERLAWFDSKGALVQAPVFVPASTASDPPASGT